MTIFPLSPRQRMLLPVLLLSGCAGSPAVTYYTLTPLPQQQAVTPAWTAERPRLELMPIRLPEEVDRPQLVLRTSPVTVSRREQWRWSGPLAEDIARTLAVSLEQGLPGVQVSAGPAMTTGAGRYRLQLDVRQLQSSLQKPAGVFWDLHWRLQGPDQKELVSCHARLGEAVATASGEALVQAHQRVLARLAGQLQPVLSAALASGRPPAMPMCPAGG